MVDKKINDYIKSFWWETSLNKIAKDNWIELIFWDLSWVWTSYISWAIKYVKDKDKYFIYINSKDYKNRQKFTLAHELWHFFLHSELLKNKWVISDTPVLFRWDFYWLKDEEIKIELEANKFAWCLLMPEYRVRELYHETHKNITLMACYFWVSVTDMDYRITDTGV